MPQIVNSCVDSLDVRISRNLHPSRLTREIFDIYRTSIRDVLPHERERRYIDLPDVGRFEIGYSSRPYELVLKNPELCYIRIANIDKWHQFGRMELGQLYISIRSVFLQLKPRYFIRALVDNINRSLFYDGVRADNHVCIYPLCDLGYQKLDQAYLQITPENTCKFNDHIVKLKYDRQRNILLGIPRLSNVSSDIVEFQRVSRMDIATDIASRRALKNSDLDKFVCRSRSDTVIYSLGDLTKEQLNDLIEEKIKKGSQGPGGHPSNNPPANLPLQHATGTISSDCSDVFAVPDTSQINRVLAPYLSSMQQLARGLVPAKTSKFLVERVHSQSRKPQTVYFGTFKSQVFAKIYNKLSSLILQNKEYMMLVWLDNGWLPEVYPEVFRTEVSISGDFLRRVRVQDKVLDLRDLDEALEAVPMIWQYFSRDWLKQVEGDIDGIAGNKNSWKMPITQYWTSVQNAFTSNLEMSRFNSKGKLLYKDRTDLHEKAKQLIKQGTSCLASAAAIMKGTQIDTTQDNKPIEGEITDDMLANVMLSEFFYSWYSTSSVEERIDRIGLDPVTDVSLAAMSRAQMLDDEGGS